MDHEPQQGMHLLWSTSKIEGQIYIILTSVTENSPLIMVRNYTVGPLTIPKIESQNICCLQTSKDFFHKPTKAMILISIVKDTRSGRVEEK